MTATPTPSEPTAYVFDTDRAEEDRRLILQSRLLDPITEPLLLEAGLGPGMHVVDLGAGAGDSAILAARIVGASGSVLGIERARETVALARHRVAEAGIDNVTFQEDDVAALDDVLAAHPVAVDAVLGRLILMWVPNRQAVLRACARRLRPGALVWFLRVPQHGLMSRIDVLTARRARAAGATRAWRPHGPTRPTCVSTTSRPHPFATPSQPGSFVKDTTS